MLTQLIHNGVLVPDPPEASGLVIRICGSPVVLDAKQEEMALAWAKKQGTPYVEDSMFVQNFMTDFCAALGLEEALPIEEVDFGPALAVVEAEREAKAQQTTEERRALAAQRKAHREALREVYGYATVDGDLVPLANYIVEPSSIFMGRGEHPLRGRWKEGAQQSDVTLNLSPDAPRPAGDWGEILWQPESLWVARWRDKLSGKMKYVWLHDSAPIKQEREAQKFDQAHELHAHLDTVRTQIERDLTASNARRRKLATACYLIDRLCLRVGDEKDADEADTVGATTLRPEHVTLHPDGRAEFEFLGKDSILWHKTLTLPRAVWENLAELIRHARPANTDQGNGNGHPSRDLPQLFPDISSRSVNTYLSRVLDGLTAKVFRTHHATVAVHQSLDGSGVQASDPGHVKWHAAGLANLEAAILCNHTKQAPAKWATSRQRYRERLRKARARVQVYEQRLVDDLEALASLRQQAREQIEAATEARKQSVQLRYEKRIRRAKARVTRAAELLRKADLRVGKITAQATIATKKRTWNLGTSLKSYIDPRVYHEWGQQVEYDVLECYYPKALRSKFSWARDESVYEEDV